MPAKNKPNEMKINRVYDAPVSVVWDAWTDPKRVAKWWGPRGFTLTTHSKELKAGGHWHYTMHGPDGTDYPNKTVYLEVDEQKRLVYDHGANDHQPALFRVTVIFTEVKNKTLMDMTMTFPSIEVFEQSKKIIKDANGNSTWDRLAEYLAESETKRNIFVINRSFDASIKDIFEMWTNPKHFANWLGPVGVRMVNIEANIEVGKSLYYKMTNDKDLTMFGKINYQKIEKPNYLQYTQIFCDQDGNLSRHPMAPTWPAVMLTKVSFSSEFGDKTRVTVVWEPFGEVTSAEMSEFIKARTGMTHGWSGSFDKLDEYLKN